MTLAVFPTNAQQQPDQPTQKKTQPATGVVEGSIKLLLEQRRYIELVH
jgi:hypothetical protein